MDDISSQRPLFSEEPSTLGFDLSAGNVWIYPENYPIREYQFSIVKKALFCNTLVCLPTGLGKTFIAAVLMYNFWRWYPKGKVVFLAPTKPLVTQQIHACHEIMGIPSEETIELTGTTNQKLREIAWTNKRVIFATPQTFHKDLEKNILPLNLVKCLVIDEAHKALGKHSYCESVRILSAQNNYFRILALSATPGDKISKVHEVITNLRISNLELRDDVSPDIIPYINERKLDIILVRLSDELARFKERYISVMDPHVRCLVRFNILQGNTGNISKGRIFYLVSQFKAKPNKTGNYGQIMKTLNILLTMYHAYELMIRHGLRAFLHFYENHADKYWMAQEVNLHELLEDIKNYLGPFPVIEPLPDGSVPDVPGDLLFGHNKFYKLKEVLERHFKSFRDKNQDTRAIVFVEYRDIVNEVYVLLLQCRPLIRPQIFVGQAGQKRKQQIEALENFRNNKVNVLISTSVGEEGLDVGEVDLIVCFDISQNSPIRLVQRMGRTGRKRDGHIIVLVTDGKEHQSLKTTLSKKDSLNSKVLQSSDIISALNNDSPRMIPNHFHPECRKMHMKVLSKTPKVKGAIKRKELQRNKKKNIESKIIENEPSVKSAGQSSIQNFFKTTKPGEKSVESTHPFLSQTQSNINNKDVTLYLSDKESEEFLTLCAMRTSRNNSHILDFEINERYVPSYRYKNLDFLRNLKIPDLSILDCVKSIPEVVVTIKEMTNQDMSISQIHGASFVSHCFEEESRFSDTVCKTNEVTLKRSFVDVIYDSSTSEKSEDFENGENAPNKFETSGNFEDLILETSDESGSEANDESQNAKLCREISLNAKNSVLEKREQIFHFNDVLDGTSSDSTNSQDLFNPVVLRNEESINEANPLREQNVSRGNSNISLTSNCSGITITQAIEKIGQLNANKSISNNSLIMGKDIPVSKIIKDSPISTNCKTIMEKNMQSVSTGKQLVYDILDSDEDLFNNVIDDISIVNDSIILNSSENEGKKSNVLRKIGEDKVQSIQDCQIMGVNSNKATSINEKENVNLAFNTINDDDWGSDFEISTSEINSPKYFKKNSLEICNKISPEDTLNVANKKTSDSQKKFSLFSRTKPSSFLQDSNDNVNISNNLNNSSIKEKNNDASDVEMFKKPNFKIPGALSLKRLTSNAPTTSNNKIHKCAPANKSNDLNPKVNERRKIHEISLNSSLVESPEIKRKKPKKARRYCKFINNEADVSSDEGDTSEGTSGEDEDLEDFVSHTQNIQEEVDMRVHYLHSVKSPLRRPGAFFIKKPAHIEENVYSQQLNLSQLNDTYVQDSFCVNEDEIEYEEDGSEDELEVTFEKLSETVNRSKRKRGDSPVFKINKRKRRKGRIQNLNNSSSSEDETEQMRRQIQKESFLLQKHENGI